MSLLSSISSWVKKIVQPVVSTVSSWFAPTTTTKTYTPTYTPTVAPVAGRSTAQLAGLIPTAKVAYTPQPTTADYLKRKAEAEAVIKWLQAPPTQAYVPGKGYVPYQAGLTPSYQEQLDRVAALKKQYSWLGTGEEVTAGTTPIGQMPTQQPVSQMTTQQPTAWDTLKSWFTPQQPALAWASAKDVVGQSQQGQSLVNSIQNWMGSHKAALQAPLLGGAAQAQGLKETATPKVSTVGGEKGFTPEEWGKMGRPLGGAYPGWEGVPLSGLKMAKTAGTPGVKFWWEGGTMMGAPTPEQLNTPEYVKGYFNTLFDPGTHPELYDGNKLNTEGETASENFWDAFTSDAKDGYYTVEQISKDPETHEALVAEMLMRDKYDKKWVEMLPTDDGHGWDGLAKVITSVGSEDPSKLPPEISQERLDAVKRDWNFGILYDAGYRSTTYQTEFVDGVQQLVDSGIQVAYDPAILNNLTYVNIEGLKKWLVSQPPAFWQQLVDKNGQLALNISETDVKLNGKGEKIYSANWQPYFPPESEMAQSEKDRYIDQQQFYNEWYWSDEAIAQRQKEREENYAYNQEKDLEGWKEYYAILDTMKLYPDASEYWSQSGKFAELRRKWETSDSGLSWDAWLQQFDFEGEWYALAPQERGEKKYVYSPRMIRLNY